MKKNILAENMRRFGTKNLREDADRNNDGYPDETDGTTNNEIINIPQQYSALINTLGNKSSSNDIIKLYNKHVVPEMGTVPLEVYEDGDFWNKVMDDIMVDTILSQLNSVLS